MWSRYASVAMLVGCCLLSSCAEQPPLPVENTLPASDAIPATEDIDAVYAEAIGHMQDHEWRAAEKLLSTITAAQPDASGAWTNLGIVHIKLGDSSAAQAAFRHAIAGNHSQIEAWNQLGMLQRRAGELDEAAASWQTVLQIDPDHANAHWNLAILYDRYRPDPAQALAHYSRYRQLAQPTDPQLDRWIAELEQQLPPQPPSMTAEAGKP